MLLACGSNSHGQLGDGTLVDKHSPKMVLNEEVIDVDGGANHSVAITKNGIFVTGDNHKGQIGLESCTVWTRLPFDDEPTRVFCGWETTFIVSHEATYVMGCNKYKQLGLSDPIYRSLTKIPLKNVKKISCSVHHTLYLADNKVYGCGSSRHGELGEEGKNFMFKEWMNALDVATGFHLSVLLTVNGISIFGRNCHQELNFSIPSASSISAGWHSVSCIRQGKLYTWGKLKHFEMESQQVICGTEHIFVKQNHLWYCWGWNEHGNCGVGHTMDVQEPYCLGPFDQVATGCGHSFFVKNLY